MIPAATKEETQDGTCSFSTSVIVFNTGQSVAAKKGWARLALLVLKVLPAWRSNGGAEVYSTL